MTKTDETIERPDDDELPDWLTARGGTITSTDAAAIMGLSPWKTPAEVWLAKTGRTDPGDSAAPTWLMRRGLAMEHAAPAELERVTGLHPVDPRSCIWSEPPAGRLVLCRHGDGTQPLVVSREHEHLAATPDLYAIPPNTIVRPTDIEDVTQVEVKTAQDSAFNEWLEDPPAHYKVQLAHSMACTGYTSGGFLVMFWSQDPVWVPFDPTVEFRELIVRTALRWWDAYVASDRPPPETGSESERAALVRAMGTDEGEERVLLGEWETVAKMRRLHEELTDFRKVVQGREAEIRMLENSLMLKAGTANRVVVKPPSHVADEPAYFRFRRTKRRAHTVPATTFKTFEPYTPKD